MYTRDQILNYHCPRWNEWPGIDLYMDQVIDLIRENTTVFNTYDQPNPVTSTMVNNYVKQKIIIPSKKKRYQREHLAFLYIVFLLKPVLSLSDICGVLDALRRFPSAEDAYNLFCSELETALSRAFDQSSETTATSGTDESSGVGIRTFQTVALSFAYTLLARLYIFEGKPQDEPNPGNKKKP